MNGEKHHLGTGWKRQVNDMKKAGSERKASIEEAGKCRQKMVGRKWGGAQLEMKNENENALWTHTKLEGDDTRWMKTCEIRIVPYQGVMKSSCSDNTECIELDAPRHARFTKGKRDGTRWVQQPTKTERSVEFWWNLLNDFDEIY